MNREKASRSIAKSGQQKSSALNGVLLFEKNDFCQFFGTEHRNSLCGLKIIAFDTTEPPIIPFVQQKSNAGVVRKLHLHRKHMRKASFEPGGKKTFLGLKKNGNTPRDAVHKAEKAVESLKILNDDKKLGREEVTTGALGHAERCFDEDDFRFAQQCEARNEHLWDKSGCTDGSQVWTRSSSRAPDCPVGSASGPSKGVEQADVLTAWPRLV